MLHRLMARHLTLDQGIEVRIFVEQPFPYSVLEARETLDLEGLDRYQIGELV